MCQRTFRTASSGFATSLRIPKKVELITWRTLAVRAGSLATISATVAIEPSSDSSSFFRSRYDCGALGRVPLPATRRATVVLEMRSRNAKARSMVLLSVSASHGLFRCWWAGPTAAMALSRSD